MSILNNGLHQTNKDSRQGFKAWLAGNQGDSTFKDLMDAVKNSVTAGGLILLMFAPLSANGWAKPFAHAMQCAGLFGAVALLVLSSLQVYFILDRMPMPGRRVVALSLIPIVASMYMAAAMGGWILIASRSHG